MHNQITRISPVLTTIPSKSAAAKIISTGWNIPLAIRDTICDRHFILYWDAGHLQTVLHENEDAGFPGTIYKEGRVFTVQYHKCTKLDCADSVGQIALSFRVPSHRYDNLAPVVLISNATSASHREKYLHQRTQGNISIKGSSNNKTNNKLKGTI